MCQSEATYFVPNYGAYRPIFPRVESRTWTVEAPSVGLEGKTPTVFYVLQSAEGRIGVYIIHDKKQTSNEQKNLLSLHVSPTLDPDKDINAERYQLPNRTSRPWKF
jgi:hypothetical protein